MSPQPSLEERAARAQTARAQTAGAQTAGARTGGARAAGARAAAPGARRRLTAAVGPERVRPLLARSDRPAIVLLTAHLLTLAGTTALVVAARGTPWVWPAWVLDGIVLAHLFALQHETAHATAFAGRRRNRAVSTVCGFVLGIAPGFFRLEHTAHHAWTQVRGRDPEMIEAPAGVARWVWFVVGVPFWTYQARTLVAHAAGRLLPGEDAFVPVRARRRVRTEAQLLLAAWTLAIVVPVLAGTDAVLVYWLVPRFLGEPAMRLARLSEHAGRPLGDDVTVNTRTLDVPAPLRLLAWNMPYHAEHHAMPAVPFHALPRLRLLLADHLTGPTGGYLAAQADVLRAGRADLR